MLENITKREHEIFNLLLKGVSPKEIAYNLNISYDTVLTHQKNIYSKLGVNSINELLVKYMTKDRHDLELSKEKPLVIVMGNDGEYGWQTKYYASTSFYGEKITAGDGFTFNCTYKSNVFINMFQVSLVDNMIEEDNWWTDLSNYSIIRRNVEPNIEYKDSITFFAAKSASSNNVRSNVLILQAHKGTKEKPTLTFTQFEILKILNSKLNIPD